MYLNGSAAQQIIKTAADTPGRVGFPIFKLTTSNMAVSFIDSHY